MSEDPDMEAGEIREIYRGRVKLIDDMDLYKQSFDNDSEDDEYPRYMRKEKLYTEEKAAYCGQEG
jgi:hypothetical protein